MDRRGKKNTDGRSKTRYRTPKEIEGFLDQSSTSYYIIGYSNACFRQTMHVQRKRAMRFGQLRHSRKKETDADVNDDAD